MSVRIRPFAPDRDGGIEEDGKGSKVRGLALLRERRGQGQVEMLSKRGDKKGLSLEAVARGEQPRAPSCRGQVCGLPCLRTRHSPKGTAALL